MAYQIGVRMRAGRQSLAEQGDHAHGGAEPDGMDRPRFQSIEQGLYALGQRLHQLCEPALWRALTTLWLLAPPTPLLFQGQEFGASAPFLYFAQHSPDLAKLVRDHPKFHFHYVTAREMANLIMAAEAGYTGPVTGALDWTLISNVVSG